MQYISHLVYLLKNNQQSILDRTKLPMRVTSLSRLQYCKLVNTHCRWIGIGKPEGLTTCENPARKFAIIKNSKHLHCRELQIINISLQLQAITCKSRSLFNKIIYIKMFINANYNLLRLSKLVPLIRIKRFNYSRIAQCSFYLCISDQ